MHHSVLKGLHAGPPGQQQRAKPAARVRDELRAASGGGALPPLHRPLGLLNFFCSSSGPAQPYFSSGSPVKPRLSKHRGFIQFWNELNCTLEIEEGKKKNPEPVNLWKTPIKYDSVHNDVLPSLDKAHLALHLPLNFIPIVAELGGSDRGRILIYLGAERELFFKWDRSNECFEHLILQWNPIFCHRFHTEARMHLEVRVWDAKWRL